MKVSGLTIREMDVAFKSGQMVLNTKVNGKIIEQMDMVFSFMLMEIFMKVYLKTIYNNNYKKY